MFKKTQYKVSDLADVTTGNEINVKRLTSSFSKRKATIGISSLSRWLSHQKRKSRSIRSIMISRTITRSSRGDSDLFQTKKNVFLEKRILYFIGNPCYEIPQMIILFKLLFKKGLFAYFKKKKKNLTGANNSK